MQCCGEYQCKQLECNGKLTVDSKINEGVKLSCCGTEDCESVACEGYTVTNTPKGEVACCGYADCQNKKCEGQTAVDVNGTLFACCGKENCNQVYKENKFKTCGKESEEDYVDHHCVYESYRCNCTPIPSDGTAENCTDWCYRDIKCQSIHLGKVKHINYIKGYNRTCKYSCSTKYYKNDSCYGECCGRNNATSAPISVTCSKKTCGNVCTNNPVYEDCMPQNKTQSRYYGQIIITDYVTCQNEKGIFTPITYNCSHQEHNYHSYTYDYGTCDLR